MKLFSKKRLKFRRVIAAAAACAALLPAAARSSDWKFSSSLNYDTGKYGTPDRTNSLYVPFTLKRYFSNAALSVTIPYVRQSSVGQVALVGGQPVRATKKTVVVAASETTTTESGLGDIMLRGAYTLMREDPNSFDLALAGKVKLPTADKDKGLGTGEMDEGVGLEFAKEVVPGWTLLADGYYTVIGDPEGVRFNDQVALDIGFYKPLNKTLALTVLYATQNAIVDGNPGPRSVSGTLSYSAPDDLQFSGGLVLGLSDGSPDLGVSAGFSRKF